jgi:hypothetical protein
MLTRNRVTHHESGTAGRNKPSRSQRPRCVLLQRNLATGKNIPMDGVSTYLALIFGTLLSSQGTDTSFVLTLSGFPPGASLRSCVSDSIRPFPDPISSALSRFPLPRFPFRRIRLYQKFRAGLTGRSFPINREWLLRNRCFREASRHSRLPTGLDPVLGNCSNLPPRLVRVNGSCGARERLTAQQGCPHIRRPSAPWRCAPLPRRPPSLRHGPLGLPGRRRTPGRRVLRRLRYRCDPRWAGPTE